MTEDRESLEYVARLPPGGDRNDDIRWLALVIRQGLKLIVTEIERHYELDKKQDRRAA